MQINREKAKADLKRHYNHFVEFGIIIVLVILLVAAKVEFKPEVKKNDLVEKQDVVKMEEVVQTKQQEEPPVPPRPEVPVEVPNDEIVKEQNFNLNSDLDLDDRLEVPPPPRTDKKDESEEKIFKVVENQPSLKGGLSGLYNCIQPYPERARKAGIEGTVIVKAIVNKQGGVENARVIRGIGGGRMKKPCIAWSKQSSFQVASGADRYTCKCKFPSGSSFSINTMVEFLLIVNLIFS